MGTSVLISESWYYSAATSFTANGSSTEWLKLVDLRKNLAVSVHCYTGLGPNGSTVLRDACSTLVAWARTNAAKVSINEIAIDAGSNGRPTYCSTFPVAQVQWADWTDFCVANRDVIVGYHCWANSSSGWWNQGDSCDPEGYHWGLTLDDGTTQTIYMDLIENSLSLRIAPAFAGMTVKTASDLAMLTDLRILIDPGVIFGPNVDPPLSDRIVIRQDPEPGSRLSVGSNVLLFL